MANWHEQTAYDDQNALQSLDDLCHHGYGERDELRRILNEDEESEPYEWEDEKGE